MRHLDHHNMFKFRTNMGQMFWDNVSLIVHYTNLQVPSSNNINFWVETLERESPRKKIEGAVQVCMQDSTHLVRPVCWWKPKPNLKKTMTGKIPRLQLVFQVLPKALWFPSCHEPSCQDLQVWRGTGILGRNPGVRWEGPRKGKPKEAYWNCWGHRQHTTFFVAPVFDSKAHE